MTAPSRPVEGARPVHGSFTHVRDLPAPPDRVFAAFAELPQRRRWFRIPSDPGGDTEHELDFRVDGGEHARATFSPSGVPERIEYRSRFLDLVPDRRIVLTEELTLDGVRRSLALVTIELLPHPDGTRLHWTDQYVLLALTGRDHRGDDGGDDGRGDDGRGDDGGDDAAHRRGGVQLLLNGLQAHLRRSVSR